MRGLGQEHLPQGDFPAMDHCNIGEGIRQRRTTLITYAIADLHGRFDLLLKSYEAIAAYAKATSGVIVRLGDYVDRGPQSREIVEFLMDDATVPVGWQRYCLRGNHEDAIVTSVDANKCDLPWLQYGGIDTLLSYGWTSAEPTVAGLARFPRAHIAWMRALPRLLIDDNRVYVHAGVDPDLPLDAQDNHAMGWMRYVGDDARGHGRRHVVHGHTPQPNGPVIVDGRTNLDTLAWETGRLVVGVFDSEIAGAASGFIEVPVSISDVRSG
jgi:serine/threonine protein phosphatase 1